ncbi:protein serine threonine kinase [Favolaschia claudopus]|uniref:Protein serine threonine kinase n=1 Tax=Favolaschia claudopus TaxID=2862362 RepID=A0AAW0DUF2_9AGAR
MSRTTQSSFIPNMLGAVVDQGSLRLTKHIGTGAFGSVYMAQDHSSFTSSSSSLSSCSSSSSSGRPSVYAVKCLLRHHDDSTDAKHQAEERSLHERVSCHPNVVSFHHAFHDTQLMYFVLEYVAGTDMYTAVLDGVYHRDTPLIKRTFAGVLDAVRFCHSQGVYHRDLKPENVLVDANGGNPRLTDFGLATDQAVCTDMSCGSGSYMAPEIFSTSGSTSYQGAHADAWALTILLINLVSAMEPWRKAEVQDGQWKEFLANPDFLREIIPISSPLNDLLMRCLRVDPAGRPSLTEMLHEFLGMKHLYMSEAELLTVSHAVRWCADGVRWGKRTPPQPQCRECGLSECDSDSGYSSIRQREEEEIRWGLGGFVHAESSDELHPPMAPFVYPSPSSSVTDCSSTRVGYAGQVRVQVHVRLSPVPSPLSSCLDSEENEMAGGGKGKAPSSKLKKFMRRMGTWRK